MITKTIEKNEEYFIQFTDEELSKLNIKRGDKFDWVLNEDGSVLLKKWATIDIDLSDWSKELLMFLVEESLKNDQTINEIIVDCLERVVENYHNDFNDDTIPKA